MASMLKKVPKAKLPRKRKKAAIKSQGRSWYHNTIKLFYICQNSPKLAEKICKFWVNSSIKSKILVIDDRPFLTQEATRFW